MQPSGSLHESIVHGFPSEQSSVRDAAHIPLWQAVVAVQVSPSSHGSPFGRLKLAGHAVLVPSHVSGGSQKLLPALG